VASEPGTATLFGKDRKAATYFEIEGGGSIQVVIEPSI
jgi:hypothetical protein